MSHATTLANLNDNRSKRLRSLLVSRAPLAARVRILHSEPLLRAAVRVLSLESRSNRLLRPSIVSRGLSIDVVNNASVIRILCASTSPTQSTLVIGALVRRCQRGSVVAGHGRTARTGRFLLTRLPRARSAIHRTRTSLHDFLRRGRVKVLSRRTESLITQVRAISGRVTAMRTDLRKATARSTALRSQLGLAPRRTLVINGLDRGPNVRRTVLSLRTIRHSLTTRRTQFGSDDPIIHRLLTRRRSLGTFLRRRVHLTNKTPGIPSVLIRNAPGRRGVARTLVRAFLSARIRCMKLRRRLGILERCRGRCRSELTDMPSLDTRRHTLRHQITMTRRACDGLLDQLRRLRIRRGRAACGAHVVRPTFPPTRPSSNNRVGVLTLNIVKKSLLTVTVILVSRTLQPDSFFQRTVDGGGVNRMGTLRTVAPGNGWTL